MWQSYKDRLAKLLYRFGNYIWPAMVVWGFERAVRSLKLVWNNRIWSPSDKQSKIASIEHLTSDTVRLTLRRFVRCKIHFDVFSLFPDTCTGSLASMHMLSFPPSAISRARHIHSQYRASPIHLTARMNTRIRTWCSLFVAGLVSPKGFLSTQVGRALLPQSLLSWTVRTALRQT